MKCGIKIVLFGFFLITVSFAREAKTADVVNDAGFRLIQGDTIKKLASDNESDSLDRKRSHKRRKKTRGRRAGR